MQANNNFVQVGPNEVLTNCVAGVVPFSFISTLNRQERQSDLRAEFTNGLSIVFTSLHLPPPLSLFLLIPHPFFLSPASPLPSQSPSLSLILSLLYPSRTPSKT